MRRRWAGAAAAGWRAYWAPALAVSVLGALACGTQPIPRVAIAGTTITVGVPNWFRPGFGTVLNENLEDQTGLWKFSSGMSPGTLTYGQSGGIEDEQRGELLFALHEDDGASNPFVSYLRVRYLTRVGLDESSPAANPSPGIAGSYARGQVLAFLDIPTGVGEVGGKKYEIRVQRWRRKNPDMAGAHHDFEQHPVTIEGGPWVGWGVNGDPTKGIPIHIVPPVVVPGNPTNFTPPNGYGNLLGAYSHQDVSLSGDLDNLRSRQKILLSVRDFTAEKSPAAWEAEVDYPLHKVEILGVELHANNRSGAVVAWQPEPTPLPADCATPVTGTIKVSVADPDQGVDGVYIIYRLHNFDVDGCGRLAAGEVMVTPMASYDADGGPFSFAAQFLIDEAWSLD